MNKNKKRASLEFSLIDNGVHVEARFFIDGKQILDYANENAKPVKVIAPLPDKKSLLDNLRYFAEHDPNNNTIGQQIDFYMSCRERDIFDQVQEIRKAVKRINRQLEGVALAKSFFEEI